MINPPTLEFRLEEDEDGSEWGHYVVHIGDFELSCADEAEFAVEVLAALEEFGTECLHAGMALITDRLKYHD